MNILYAFIIVAVLGLLLGAGLAFADKALKVKKDEKLEALEAIMPGANCGGCGFAGCSAYAEAVAEGTAKPGLCSPGGKALAEKMGEILGISVEVGERKVAYVFCQGGKVRNPMKPWNMQKGDVNIKEHRKSILTDIIYTIWTELWWLMFLLLISLKESENYTESMFRYGIKKH